MARGHHDIGGLPGAGPIDQSEHTLSDWEILADAVNQALGARGVKRTDEMRRAREEMDSAAYRDMTYYERWIASIEAILIEKKILVWPSSVTSIVENKPKSALTLRMGLNQVSPVASIPTARGSATLSFE